jgi:hypothetical protein
MDEYINSFKDLIDLMGYMDRLTIVMKFRCRLKQDIQDQIAQLANGCPADNNVSVWYDVALICAENIESNTLFHGILQTLVPLTHFCIPAPMVLMPAQPLQITFAPLCMPQNSVPMDIDAMKKKTPLPGICYRCSESEHCKPDCPHLIDVYGGMQGLDVRKGIGERHRDHMMGQGGRE